MHSKALARHGARLEHQRRKLARARRELRALPEIREALQHAEIQLHQAIIALDQEAGAQMRRELEKDASR